MPAAVPLLRQRLELPLPLSAEKNKIFPKATWLISLLEKLLEEPGLMSLMMAEVWAWRRAVRRKRVVRVERFCMVRRCRLVSNFFDLVF